MKHWGLYACHPRPVNGYMLAGRVAFVLVLAAHEALLPASHRRPVHAHRRQVLAPVTFSGRLWTRG
jgi:hypothetical protein